MIHLFRNETIIGEGRTLHIVSIAHCGAIVETETGITTSRLEVTCPRCAEASEKKF
jgi:phage FluMu protein Com